MEHISVLRTECVKYLNIKPDGIYIDGTLGMGGHSEAIAEKLTTGRLIGIDRDDRALEQAGRRLACFGDRVTLVKGNFGDLGEIMDSVGEPLADGMLFDLGVSSPQLDVAERGFSYMKDAPLDMRMSQSGVTAEELVTLLDTIEEEGVFTPEESDLIKSAIEFGQTDARDIMTPRVDVAAWDIDDGLDALLADQEVMGFSRIPVYRDSIDNIIGILSTKKLLKALVSGQEIDLEAMLTQPLFVHMTRSIPSILLEFRKTHGQMAVVVDEFGGTMGILTMEDIAEELVGEIFDETDEVELPILRQPDGSYLVDGSVSIDDLFEALDYDPVDFDSDYTTVGGWVTELLDRFPAPDDVVTYGPLTLTVLQASSMRVEQLSVVMAEPEEPEED